MSENTKRLLYAKALLAEIENEVCEVLADSYGEDIQEKLFIEVLEKFTYPLGEKLDSFIEANISDKINEIGCLSRKEIIV